MGGRVNSLLYSLVSSDLNRHPPQQDIATAKTVRTFLIAETIAITASSFFLLPSAILWFFFAIQRTSLIERKIFGCAG
jgi:hypothetical protein